MPFNFGALEMGLVLLVVLIVFGVVRLSQMVRRRTDRQASGAARLRRTR